MSALYVGQRVKVVRLRADAISFVTIGMEGTINQIGAFNKRCELVDYGVTINGDANWCFYADELEPLTPPNSQELTTWDAMPCTRDGKYRQEQYA